MWFRRRNFTGTGANSRIKRRGSLLGQIDSVPPVITRVSAAVIGPYDEGDLPTDAYVAGVYASSADPGNESVTPSWFVDAIAWDGVSTLVGGEVVTLQESVSDTIPTTPRVFNYGPVVVAAAPSTASALLLESGDFLLLENGDKLLLEAA